MTNYERMGRFLLASFVIVKVRTRDRELDIYHMADLEVVRESVRLTYLRWEGDPVRTEEVMNGLNVYVGDRLVVEARKVLHPDVLSGPTHF